MVPRVLTCKEGEESIECRRFHVLDVCVESRAWNVYLDQSEHTECSAVHLISPSNSFPQIRTALLCTFVQNVPHYSLLSAIMLLIAGGVSISCASFSLTANTSTSWPVGAVLSLFIFELARWCVPSPKSHYHPHTSNAWYMRHSILSSPFYALLVVPVACNLPSCLVGRLHDVMKW